VAGLQQQRPGRSWAGASLLSQAVRRRCNAEPDQLRDRLLPQQLVLPNRQGCTQRLVRVLDRRRGSGRGPAGGVPGVPQLRHRAGDPSGRAPGGDQPGHDPGHLRSPERVPGRDQPGIGPVGRAAEPEHAPRQHQQAGPEQHLHAHGRERGLPPGGIQRRLRGEPRPDPAHLHAQDSPLAPVAGPAPAGTTARGGLVSQPLQGDPGGRT